MAKPQRSLEPERPAPSALGNLPALARQLVRTRPRQLAERARKLVRNLLHDALPTLVLGAAPTSLAPSANPPRPVFPRRDGPVKTGSEDLRACLGGVEHGLCGAIDWNPAGSTALERFQLHYMEYLEAVDEPNFARLCLDWIESNPRNARGAWRTSWASYVISIRTVVWMQELVRRGNSLAPRVRERIVASLVEQLAHLEQNLELDIGGNHLIKNYKALLWGASFFEGASARRWFLIAARGIAAELREQVLEDGMHYERSPSYHAQVFADLIECAHVAPRALRARLEVALDPMAQALVDLTHPDGTPSLFNDGGLTGAYSTEECLEAWSKVTGASKKLPRTVFALEKAGYFGLRTPGSYVVADCGTIAPDHLPAHGHGDVLSFEWSVDGERFVVDAGVFEYEPGDLRDESRSTRAHNTLTLDHHDQAEFWSSFRVGRRPRVTLERFERHELGFVLQGSHDGYAHLRGSPIHRRRLVASGDSLTIQDDVEGGKGQVVRTRLLLHPEVRVERDDFHRVILHRDDIEVQVESRDAIEVVTAFWSPDFGERLQTRQLVFCHPPAPCSTRVTLARVRTWTREEADLEALLGALPHPQGMEVRP
ncbi:MAG: alginate lyase family protein [Planctomycetota bacterium]|nr:alginate lyase family protein [Planctomycetota bacterium]